LRQRPFGADVGEVGPRIASLPARHVTARTLRRAEEQRPSTLRIAGNGRVHGRRRERAEKRRQVAELLVGQIEVRHRGAGKAVLDGLNESLRRHAGHAAGQQAGPLAAFPCGAVTAGARPEIELAAGVDRSRILRQPLRMRGQRAEQE